MIAISQATEGRFFADMLFGDMLPKLFSGDEGQFALPGFHLLLLRILIFPATYALPAAARLALDALRAPAHDDSARRRIPLSARLGGPDLLVFELTPTKLPHYTLPAYPGALRCSAARA